MRNTRYPFLNFIISIFFCFIGVFQVHSQSDEIKDELMISSIQSGDVETVCRLFNSSNSNVILKPDNLTPLVIALRADQPKLVKYLLDNGADPNLRCKSRTPLMYACQVISKQQIRMLLSKGAKVNEIDSIGTTALMIAALSQPHGVARLLLRRGASLNVRNNQGFTACDIAIRSNNKLMVNYLRTMFERRLPNYFDGPYAIYKGGNKIGLSYFKYDSLKKRTDKYSLVYNLKKTKGLIRGLVSDTNIYQLKTKYEPENSIISGVDKMFVIGDVHGQCDTLKKFLIDNHIIDKNLKWAFGKGHLVFLGDIFDRGETVTEALWLIYRLENEAASEGGRVHLILGNHEMMIFSGHMQNLSDISDKYYYLFKKLKLDYQKYYSNKTLIGRWLRSKNTILKINDILFVHGGICPDLLKYNISIDSVNHVINKYLTVKQNNKDHTHLLDFLLSINGPFWYRGMIPLESFNSNLSEEDVNLVLDFYKINTIMVGHTNVPQINSYYSGKVYGLDVPFYRIPGKPIEAVYVDSSGYYRVFTSGKKEKMK